MNRSLRALSRSFVGLVLLGLLLYPIFWLVSASLQEGVSVASFRVWPTHPSLSGYATAWDDQSRNILTSLIVAIGTAVLSVVIATPAAFGLARLRTVWVDAILLVLFIAQIVPGIVLANSLYTMFVGLGLVNSVFGLMLANASSGLPFAILLLRAFLRDLDPEILEAARMDGAGIIRSFVSIVVPLSRNALITVAIFGFLGGWGDFLFALTLTTGADLRTMTIGIYQYLSSPNVPWNAVMAAGVLASIPAIVLLLGLQRHLKAGISSGSGK